MVRVPVPVKATVPELAGVPAVKEPVVPPKVKSAATVPVATERVRVSVAAVDVMVTTSPI
jgi:hypothetical protein